MRIPLASKTLGLVSLILAISSNAPLVSPITTMQ
jgi:hypothetical protein